MGSLAFIMACRFLRLASRCRDVVPFAGIDIGALALSVAWHTGDHRFRNGSSVCLVFTLCDGDKDCFPDIARKLCPCLSDGASFHLEVGTGYQESGRNSFRSPCGLGSGCFLLLVGEGVSVDHLELLLRQAPVVVVPTLYEDREVAVTFRHVLDEAPNIRK